MRSQLNGIFRLCIYQNITLLISQEESILAIEAPFPEAQGQSIVSVFETLYQEKKIVCLVLSHQSHSTLELPAEH